MRTIAGSAQPVVNTVGDPSVERFSYTVTVANGAQVSGGVDLGGLSLVGFITPSTLTSSTVRFQVSNDGATYYPLYDKTGTRFSVTVSGSEARAFGVDVSLFFAWRYVKVDMGSAEGAARSIQLLARPL